MRIKIDERLYAQAFDILGRAGEREYRLIDCDFPQVNGAQIYKLRFELCDGSCYELDITSGSAVVPCSLLASAGLVKTQFIAVSVNDSGNYDIIAKSNVFYCIVGPSIEGSVEPVPTYEQAQLALEKILDALKVYEAKTKILTEEQYLSMNEHDEKTVYYVVKDGEVSAYLGDVLISGGAAIGAYAKYFEQGTYDGSGEHSSATNRIRLKEDSYLTLPDDCSGIKVTSADAFGEELSYDVISYDRLGSYLGETYWKDNGEETELNMKASKLSVVLKYSDERKILPEYPGTYKVEYIKFPGEVLIIPNDHMENMTGNDSTGELGVANSARLSSYEYIDVSEYSSFTVLATIRNKNADNTYCQFYIYWYDSDKKFNGTTYGWTNGGSYISVPENAGYMRIILRTFHTQEIPLSDVDMVKIYMK